MAYVEEQWNDDDWSERPSSTKRRPHHEDNTWRDQTPINTKVFHNNNRYRNNNYNKNNYRNGDGGGRGSGGGGGGGAGFNNENMFKEYIDIPMESVGRIIGRGGSNIQSLQHEFNVRINLDRSTNTVSVSGKVKQDIHDALTKIRQQVDQCNSGSGANMQRRRSPSPRNDDRTNETAAADGNDKVNSSDCCLPNGLIDWTAAHKMAEEHEKQIWAKLPPMEKNFYKEDPEVANLDDKEVARIRAENNRITVKRVFVDESKLTPLDKIPNPVWKFEHCFAAYPEIMAAISKQGFEKPSPIQAQAWPVLLQGNDMIGIAQTGTGKTLAFLLPALIHTEFQPIPRSQRKGPNVLICAPTRELALQIEKEVSKYPYRDMKAVCIYGGGSRQGQIERVEEGVEIIICTPGRLNDLYSAKIIDVTSITYLVLDEADRMLDMGFEPQIRRFMVDIRPNRQTIMTSATWPPNVRYLASSYMKNPIQVIVGTLDLAATHTVEQILEFMHEDEKPKKIKEFVATMAPTDKIIIFCGRKARADDLSSDFGIKGILAQCLHGSRDQWDREQAIADITSGEVKILIATDLASRGLDIDDITHVINYDFPRNIEEYVHRIGRTGRAGRYGKSISFITREDWAMAPELIKILEEANHDVPHELKQMAERFNAMKSKRADEMSEFKHMRGGRNSGRGRDRDRGGNQYSSKWR